MSIDAREEALLRGWIERLPYPVLAGLYLDGADPLQARAAVAALRETLAQKARRSRRPDLQAFWEEGHPAAGGGLDGWQRRARLALDQLARLPEPSPRPGDPPGLWLPARAADALARAGLDTLEAVRAAAAEGGIRWAHALPGVGPAAARAALRLLRSMGADPFPPAESAEGAAAARALLPALRQARPGLDGSQGGNRERQRRCRVDAADDYAAVEAWLSLHGSDATRRAYRREAERLLLWCLLRRGKAFSDLDTPDCADYLAFLRSPDADWAGPYGAARGSASWKPFRQRRDRRTGEPARGLSPASLQLARTAANALCGWLAGQGYLAANPFDGLPWPKPPGRRARHSLSPPQWQALLAHCRRLAADAPGAAGREKYRRIEFVLRLAHATGLRLGELAAARWGDVAADTGADGGPQWWLRVAGKGGKEREVPLSAALVGMIDAEMDARGHARAEARDPAAPLAGRARLRRAGPQADAPLTESGLHRLLTGFFKEAAAALEDAFPPSSAPLAEATAHWLRHTHASHAVAAGLPLDVLRENLGHADLATTSLYVRAARDRQYSETAARQALDAQN